MKETTQQKVSVAVSVIEQLEPEERRAASLFLARRFLAALDRETRDVVIFQVRGSA